MYVKNGDVDVHKYMHIYSQFRYFVRKSGQLNVDQVHTLINAVYSAITTLYIITQSNGKSHTNTTN